MFFIATGEDINIVEEETLEESILYGPVRVIAPAIIPSILREIQELEFMKEDEDSIK